MAILRMRLVHGLLACGVAVTAGVGTLPAAHAEEVKHHPSMLYTVSGTQFSLTSTDGQTGVLTVSDPDEVLQFTDRPDHWSDRIPASAMLQVLGLTGRPLDVRGQAPNAVLALEGRRTLPLEITHGSMAKDGTLRLRVARLGPTLPTATGSGSLFVDSVTPLRVTLTRWGGQEWGSLDVYWEGSHWSIVPFMEGVEEEKAKFYRKDFFAISDPSFPVAQAFWQGSDTYEVEFMLVDGDLTKLRVVPSGQRGGFLIDANAPGGPACDPSCTLETTAGWS
jgi:hypothetical protein